MYLRPAVTTERTRIERYDHAAIEPRWQARWEELGLHRTDLEDESRPPYYLLTMYDYPSGNLHVGHWYAEAPEVTRLGRDTVEQMVAHVPELPEERGVTRRGVGTRVHGRGARR